jgi:hypothetical protein
MSRSTGKTPRRQQTLPGLRSGSSRRAKAKNRDRCTALLWSVQHVAVVEINDGSVSHSDPIPLLAAYGFDEEGFISALHLLWHYLPYPRCRIVDERAISLAPPSSNFGDFPIEVVMKIMAFTDQLHYPKYQFLSHSFFSLWWKLLRLASYTILPDAEEIGDTSRCLTAYPADANAPVKLRFAYLWGKKTGNIWRCDFSLAFTVTSYRLQRFYSDWPDSGHLSRKRTDRTYRLPRVSDQFSGQRDILFCAAEPM